MKRVPADSQSARAVPNRASETVALPGAGRRDASATLGPAGETPALRGRPAGRRRYIAVTTLPLDRRDILYQMGIVPVTCQ
jgi:hypothetical protein